MTDRRVVAIHQPTFFPWLGYFDKLARSQVFILLDDAQFPKTGGYWGNRVQILVGGSASWVTMPVVRDYEGTRSISAMEICDRAPWRRKLLRTLEVNYGRAPCFEQTFPLIASLIGHVAGNVAEYNVHVIRSLVVALGLDPARLALASTLNVQGQGTERLVGLVRSVAGTAYLCGGGSAGYQEDAKFTEAGLELIYQRFEHPVYPQERSPRFTPGLSIIDALFNMGFEKTAKLLEQGESKWPSPTAPPSS